MALTGSLTHFRRQHFKVSAQSTDRQLQCEVRFTVDLISSRAFHFILILIAIRFARLWRILDCSNGWEMFQDARVGCRLSCDPTASANNKRIILFRSICMFTEEIFIVSLTLWLSLEAFFASILWGREVERPHISCCIRFRCQHFRWSAKSMWNEHVHSFSVRVYVFIQQEPFSLIARWSGNKCVYDVTARLDFAHFVLNLFHRSLRQWNGRTQSHAINMSFLVSHRVCSFYYRIE